MKRTRTESIVLVILAVLLAGLGAVARAEDPHRAGRTAEERYDERREMVTRQLKGRDIRDPEVLRAMGTVPRHRFVPERFQPLAYADQPLPIGHEQTISQPYIVALMSELLAVRPGQRVLEVGTGSGYQAAILAEMGVSVYSIEIIPELSRNAEAVLSALDYHQVKLKIGDGYLGWPEAAPFDGIIVTCAPSDVPEPLAAQLAEGGRMVIPVGDGFAQQLVRLTKKKGHISQEKIVDVRFVPMVDPKGKKY